MVKKSHLKKNVEHLNQKVFDLLNDGIVFKSLGKKERGALYRKMDGYFKPGYDHNTMKRWFLYLQFSKRNADYVQSVMIHCLLEVLADSVYIKLDENVKFDEKIKVFRERKEKNTKAVKLFTNLLNKYSHE